MRRPRVTGVDTRSEVRQPLGSRAKLACAVVTALAAVAALILGGWSGPPGGQVERTPSRSSALSALSLRPDPMPPAVARAVLEGTVRQADGGAVAGARVCATCAHCALTDAQPATCASSDESGAFRFSDALTAGSYLVTAAAEGFRPGTANGGSPFLLRDGEERRDLRIVLQPGGAMVTGWVQDALGGPVFGARVQLARFVDGTTPTTELETDAEGRFTTWTEAGRITLRAESAGYAPVTVHRSAPSRDVRLVLTPESTLRGTVVAAGTRTPIANVRVLGAAAGSTPKAPAASSDEDGRFVLRQLEPGLYTLVGESEHWRGTSTRPIELGLGESVDDVLLEVVPAVSIVGRVLRAGNRPCQRGRVILGPPHALSAPSATPAPDRGSAALHVPSFAAAVKADGSVHFKGIPRGTYHVSMQCIDHVLEEGPPVVEVDDRDLEVTWRVAEGLGLTIHVVDARNAPVPHARVFLTLPGRDGGPGGKMAFTTDADGKAQVSKNLYPGDYTVEADPAQGGESVRVSLRAGMGVVPVTIRTNGSGGLTVRVQDADGHSVDGLVVRAKLATEAEAEGAHKSKSAYASDVGAGTYLLRSLAEGVYRVEVRDGVNPPVLARGPGGDTVAVKSGANLELEARLPRPVRIEGRVVDEQGAPVANAWVSASDAQRDGSQNGELRALKQANGGANRVLTDLEGSFTLEGLVQHAVYHVRAEQPYGAFGELRDVKPGGSIVIKVPSPGRLTGRVVGPTGAPATDCQVHAYHAASGAVRRVNAIDREGRFEIDGVPAGDVQLSAASPDGAFAELRLQLTPGQKVDALRLVLATMPAPDDAANTLAAGNAREMPDRATAPVPTQELTSSREQAGQASSNHHVHKENGR